jgi:hypothetical protein
MAISKVLSSRVNVIVDLVLREADVRQKNDDPGSGWIPPLDGDEDEGDEEPVSKNLFEEQEHVPFSGINLSKF